MALEDFEKSLAEEKSREQQQRSLGEGDRERERRKRHHHHHHHHRHHRTHDEDRSEHRHKRRRRSDESEEARRERRRTGAESVEAGVDDEDEWVEKERDPKHTHESSGNEQESSVSGPLQRDKWMEAPSASDIEYSNRRQQPPTDKMVASTTQLGNELKVYKNELNQELKSGNHGDAGFIEDVPAQHEVGYTFGDSGPQWRMTRLKAVYRQAEETGKPVEEVALDKYGDPQAFDDAREEQIELDRRQTYGRGYVRKEKPSGELYQERKLQAGIRSAGREDDGEGSAGELPQGEVMKERSPPARTLPLDQTALNKLKAQMMKAKLRDASEAVALEAEYNNALSAAANNRDPGVVVLGAMENRMLAGGPRGDVKQINTKRGRERGLVEENEDMSIEDMVRQERRSKGERGGEGRRLAERIAKDGAYKDDIDYMDENADKLAKRIQKSEINLRNTAISDFQRLNRILDTCPLCHHEDTNTPPVAPVVSLATRVYLTLPTEPEISPGGACIVPIQHRTNLLECDDDEWEEIRNFMKCLTRMYHAQKRAVIFYENAASPDRKRHAAMNAVPLPPSLGDVAPAFFREAILSSDEEWSQHKKIIDTLSLARDRGMGKWAFRRTLVKEMPYFHVWFEIDGGMGHVVEDERRWPKGDLFAREILGGMLDVPPEVIKRQGRWSRGGDSRVGPWRAQWSDFDWTKALMDG